MNPPRSGWAAEGPPWARPASERLSTCWNGRVQKERRSPGFTWIRSLRPPEQPLGGAQVACLRGHTGVSRAWRGRPTAAAS